MSNPYLDLVRLGYLMGDLRLIAAVDTDTTLQSIYTPSIGAPTVGTRFLYKGEPVSDLSANRALGALGAQVDFGIMEDVRPKSLIRIADSGYYSIGDKYVVCWVKEPVVLPWDIDDLPAFARACDVDNNQLMADMVPLPTVDAYIVTGAGALTSLYAGGALVPKQMLAIDPVTTVFPWGVRPTTSVVHIAEVTVRFSAFGIVSVDVDSGALDITNFDDGLFYDNIVLGGCVIASIAVGGVFEYDITLHPEWVHTAIPAAPNTATVVGTKHVVPGMYAEHTGGNVANNGWYLITDVTSAGDLVLNAIDGIATLEETLNPRPVILDTTGAPGSITIWSHLAWFPVFEISAVPDDLVASGKIPTTIMYQASLPTRDRTLEDVSVLPEYSSGILEGVVKNFLGTPYSVHWTTQPTDSIKSLDARLDAVTLDGAYRNVSKVDAYEGASTGISSDGRHIFVDGGPVNLEDVDSADPLSLRSWTPTALLQLHSADVANPHRAEDRIGHFNALLSTDQQLLNTGTNPDPTDPHTLTIIAPAYTLRLMNTVKSTTRVRSASEDGIPTFFYFSYDDGFGTDIFITAYAELVTTAGIHVDVDLGFIDGVPAPNGIYNVTALFIHHPIDLNGAPVTAPEVFSRPYSVFSQLTVPYGDAASLPAVTPPDIGFLRIVPHSSIMHWVDRNPAATTSLGYRYDRSWMSFGRRVLTGAGGDVQYSDILGAFDEGMQPVDTMLWLFDTSEGYDGANPTARPTLTIGSPLYFNDDETSHYYGPWTAQINVKQLIWASYEDAPNADPTTADALVGSTMYAKPDIGVQAEAMVVPTTNGHWYFLTYFEKVHIVNWDAVTGNATMECLRYGLFSEHVLDSGGTHGFYVQITNSSDSSYNGIFTAVPTDNGVDHYFELYAADSVAPLNTDGVTGYVTFIRAPRLTHALDEDHDQFAMERQSIPSRRRYHMYDMTTAAPAVLDDAPIGAGPPDVNDWSQYLTGAGTHFMWNISRGVFSDIAGVGAHQITRDAYTDPAILDVNGDFVVMGERGFTGVGGAVTMLADVGRQGQVSSYYMKTGWPVGDKVVDEFSSLFHFDLESLDLSAAKGTASLDPLAEFKYFLATGSFVGNVGISDFYLDVPARGSYDGNLPFTAVDVDAADDATYPLFKLERYDDNWYLLDRIVKRTQMSTGVITGNSINPAATDPSSIGIDSAPGTGLQWLNLWPWSGPGGPKENTAGDRIVRTIRIPPKALAETWKSDAAAITVMEHTYSNSPFEDHGQTRIRATTVDTEEIGALGWYVEDFVDAGVLHRVSASLYARQAASIAGVNELHIVGLLTRSVHSDFVTYASCMAGYTDAAGDGIMSTPSLWDFNLAGVHNVPEGASAAGYNVQDSAGATAAYKACTSVEVQTGEALDYHINVRAPRSLLPVGSLASVYRPVWMPRYALAAVKAWTIGGITYDDVKFVQFSCNGAAEVEYAATTMVDCVNHFGIRVTPFLRWEGAAGLTQGDVLERRMHPLSQADMLYLWNDLGETDPIVQVFPILGPAYMTDGARGAGLVVYDPGGRLTIAAPPAKLTYGAVPALCAKGLTFWAGLYILGDAGNGVTAEYGVSDVAVEYMPISIDMHAVGEYFTSADEPASVFGR